MKKVSILMPMYNSEEFLRESIESVLNQTYTEIELIIVDDGSQDSSLEIVKSYNNDKIKLYKNSRNRGLPYTRNRLLDLATGEYIALLDSDDIALPERIEKQVEFLEKNKDVDILGSSAIIIGKYTIEKSCRVITGSENIKANLIFGNCMINSSVIMRSKFIKDNNLRYREDCRFCQDYSFFIDASEKGKIENLNFSTIKYRSGHNNITNISKLYNIEERTRILREASLRALRINKFFISKDEEELLCKYFFDRNLNPTYDESEFKILIGVLDKIVNINKQEKSIGDKILIAVIKKNLLELIINFNINSFSTIFIISRYRLGLWRYLTIMIRKKIKVLLEKK